jgi:hypothetical protein
LKKIRSAEKNRVGRETATTGIFLGFNEWYDCIRYTIINEFQNNNNNNDNDNDNDNNNNNNEDENNENNKFDKSEIEKYWKWSEREINKNTCTNIQQKCARRK